MEQCFGWLKRSVILTALVAVGLCTTARATVTTNVWVGGSSGNFGDVANWDTSAIPNTKDSVAVFTNSADVSISTSFCEVYVQDGDVKFSHTYRLTGVASSAKEVTVNVAEGASFQMSQSNSDFFVGSTTVTFVKKGKGILKSYSKLSHWSTESSMFKTLDVREGTLSFLNSQNLHTKDKTVFIRSGARLVGTSGATLIPSTYAVTIEEGGVLDLGNPTESKTLRAVIGGGVVSNASNTASAPLILRNEGATIGSAGTFTGRYYGYIQFAPTNDCSILVASADMFADATVTLADGLTKPFSFAAGIGTFRVKTPELFTGYTTDVAGEPITFETTFSSDYTHTTAGDDDWSNITATMKGNVTEKSGGTWTLGDITMTPGKTFTVSEDATGSSIHIKGGVMTNIQFVVGRANYVYGFDGVKLSDGSKKLTAADDRIYRQTAGEVWLGGLTAASAADDTHATNSIFYYASGGKLTIQPNVYYQYGLGLEASGTADVKIKSGSYGSVVLSHKGYGYTLRVKDEAKVCADNLNFHYYKGGTCTSRVEVADSGVLEISGTFGSTGSYTPANSDFRNFLKFDGGTMRSTASGNVRWPNVGTGEQTFSATVGAGGATVDIPSDFGAMRKLSWVGPMASGVTGGADGGLTKTGYGVFYTWKAINLTGPLTVRKGAFMTDAGGTNAVGTGSVSLDAAMLLASAGANVAIASNETSTVTFAGNSLIRKDVAGTLTIGTEGRKTTPLVCGERGFLALMPTSQSDFSTYRFRALGGLALNKAGVSSLPIFGFVWGQPDDTYGYNRGSYDVRLLSCDDDGFVQFTQGVSSVPEDASEATILYQHDGTPMTVAKNAHVGAMEIYGGMYSSKSTSRTGGVVINSGVTLTVGEGAGKIAPISMNNMLNNVGTQYGNARLIGAGTLDFAGAEGIFVFNSAYSAAMPALIACRLAGTGGITFYSPSVLNLSETCNNASRNQSLVRAVSVTGNNAYSGGTYVDNVIVIPGCATALGGGTVTISGERYRSGELHFDEDYSGSVFTNAIVASGKGFYFTGDTTSSYGTYWGTRAAISAHNKAIKLTGSITLTDDATIATSGDDGEITLTGAITGAGTLHVTAGTVVVKKDAVAAYDAGKIVADEGATIVVRRRQGFLGIIR